MKTTLMAAAFAAALGLSAAPAEAQRYHDRDYRDARHYVQHPYARRSAQQLHQIRFQLRNGERRGLITRWEARRIAPELRRTQRLRARYLQSRGLSRWEARDLRRRIQDLRYEVHRALTNRARYDDRGYRGWR